MKKRLLILFILFSFLNFFVQGNNSRIQQVIYDPVIKERELKYSSPLALWYSLYRIHVFFGNGWDFVSVSDYEYSNLLISLRDIISYNILDLLEYEIDKTSVMEKYVSSLDNYLVKSDVALSNLREEMNLSNSSMQYCLSQKNISDKLYADSLQSHYNQHLLDDAIENSKKYGKCISDARIDYNSKKILADKISVYSSVVKIKYDYLNSNKYDIVQNYDLMKWDILERLVIIKRMLQKYDL